MCHTFLHLEWSWLAYLCISSFQQTWKILILETRSWLFSYHSGLHWKAYFLWMLNFPIYCPVSVMLDKRSKVSGRMRHRSYRIHRSCRLHREDTVVQIPTGLPQSFVRLERGVQSNGCLHTAVKLLCRKRLYVYAGTTENLTVIQS